MVTGPDRPGGGNPARAERAMIAVLSRLLPAGFRDRQRAEWTGDLVELSAAGARARWRYLFAAAWTLPALRAHAGKPGVDRPTTIVPPSLTATLLVQKILVGLGLPVVCWLIAVPFRYFLLDIPARLAPDSGMPFDPKDLWPIDGPFIFLMPLWVVLSFGAWALIFDWMLVGWLGVTALLLGLTQRGAGWRSRATSGLIGAAVVAIALQGLGVRIGLGSGSSPYQGMGLATAVLGGVAIIAGVSMRGISRRSRVLVLLTGLAAVTIYFWNQTPMGIDMITWYMD
ncbi:hypothetical protein Rhe02_06450 [Rhizocola hellebori]|uniref:Uncharacterized protein n=1 Tax=Rhizocola hellebori TaxID=1392758 RepID=A0A8J3VDW2_9ACTN|nr:hypothetical protein [Rhizocola hellebori]GIH02578.1 hypothetical protein Rhe02_06450 [Rhizocola hellebori]